MGKRGRRGRRGSAGPSGALEGGAQLLGKGQGNAEAVAEQAETIGTRSRAGPLRSSRSAVAGNQRGARGAGLQVGWRGAAGRNGRMEALSRRGSVGFARRRLYEPRVVGQAGGGRPGPGAGTRPNDRTSGEGLAGRWREGGREEAMRLVPRAGTGVGASEEPEGQGGLGGDQGLEAVATGLRRSCEGGRPPGPKVEGGWKQGPGQEGRRSARGHRESDSRAPWAGR